MDYTLLGYLKKILYKSYISLQTLLSLMRLFFVCWK